MRASILKPNLSVDVISYRLKITNSYITRFPLPVNKSFSEGEIIEIALSRLPEV